MSRNRRRVGEACLLGFLCRAKRLGPWIAFIAVGFTLRAAEPGKLAPGIYAEIQTSRGTAWAELYYQRAPLTVANFVGLAEGRLGPKPGVPFYRDLVFHRVVPGFVIQGGDPAGTGEGGPGYAVPDEFEPTLSHDAAGVLSMANDGPDTDGSQFFITLVAVRRLDFLHSVFGRVIRGAEVLPRIVQGDRMDVVIHRIGADARGFQADRAALERLARAKPKYSETGGAAFFEDADKLLPADPPRARTFGYKLANVARATGRRIFARVIAGGDLSGEAREKRAREMAARLKLERDDVLAIYSAAADAWSIEFGSLEALLVSGFPPETNLIEWKRDRVLAAEREAARWIAELEKSTGSVGPKQRVKLKVDGMLNELIEVLVQAPATRALHSK